MEIEEEQVKQKEESDHEIMERVQSEEEQEEPHEEEVK